MADRQEQIQRAAAVKARHEADLMRRPGVRGVGIGFRRRGGTLREDEVCIVVMVLRKLGLTDINPADRLPAELDGVPVDVQEVGDITALG
jgi:hypothetical protein